MAEIHWLNAVNGSFDTGANWSGGAVPGAGDDAILDAAGGGFSVTAYESDTVDSLQLSSNASIGIENVFTSTSGTGSGANAGSIVVENEFITGGRIRNSGTIETISTENAFSAFVDIVSDTKVSGAGTIDLNDYGSKRDRKSHIAMVVGSTTNQVTLTNVDNTIEATDGSDTISVGEGSAIVNNKAGAITSHSELVLAPIVECDLRSLVNSGEIETTTNARITVEDADISGKGGRIVAELESNVSIEGCTVVGQSLTTDQEGSIGFSDSNVTLKGTIQNGGVIAFTSSGANTALKLSGDTVLTGGDIGDGGGKFFIEGRILAGKADVVLDNLNNTIYGEGQIGNAKMTLVNEASGAILADAGLAPMIIDTGANTIENGGLLEGSYNSLVLKSPVANDGTIIATEGTVQAQGVVSGDGVAQVQGGLLQFLSAFNENVTFNGSGELALARSEGYSGAISGFSTTGATSLGVMDIEFVNAGEATFSGTAISGILTISDGTHSAHIDLIGDYQDASFTAASDGQGGTIVVAGGAEGAKSPHAFISAMAAFRASAAHCERAGVAWPAREPLLAAPRVVAA